MLLTTSNFIFRSAEPTVIADLGDLEAKLSAYFSKVEQEKIAETLVVPPPVRAPKPIIPPEQQEVKLTLEPNMGAYSSHHERERDRGRDRDGVQTIVRRIDVPSSKDSEPRGRNRDRERDR